MKCDVCKNTIKDVYINTVLDGITCDTYCLSCLKKIEYDGPDDIEFHIFKI